MEVRFFKFFRLAESDFFMPIFLTITVFSQYLYPIQDSEKRLF